MSKMIGVGHAEKGEWRLSAWMSAFLPTVIVRISLPDTKTPRTGFKTGNKEGSCGCAWVAESGLAGASPSQVF
jgi:hypothetical protein